MPAERPAGKPASPSAAGGTPVPAAKQAPAAKPAAAGSKPPATGKPTSAPKPAATGKPAAKQAPTGKPAAKQAPTGKQASAPKPPASGKPAPAGKPASKPAAPAQASAGKPKASPKPAAASKSPATTKPAPGSKQAAAPKASDQEVTVFGKTMKKADVFKLWGLLAFFVIMVVIVVLLWPMLGQLLQPEGREELITRVREAGPLGVLILLGLQFLQIVVAFIPGEVVQVAAGILYGPWLGALIILVGCYFSSWFIYELVHRLGQPFVEAMVPTKYLDKFRAFEQKGRLVPLVAILFLIPGLPKDTFTYLVPLTGMPRRQFLNVTTLARIPGVLMSTIAASGLEKGSYVSSIIIFAVLAVLAVLAWVFKDRLIDLISRGPSRKD